MAMLRRRNDRFSLTRVLTGCSVLLGVALGSVACDSVIGIERLSAGPRPGADAGDMSGAAGRGGGGGQGGSDDPGGNGGSAGNAGMSQGGSSGAPVAMMDAGADATSGGPIVVTGRVIDFFQRPVPNAPVSIGDVTVLSGSNGEFSIPDVLAPYTASLIANTTQGGFPFQHYAYVYEGLTRPDPTLQVYAGLNVRGSTLTVAFENVTFDDPNRGVIFGFSSADGRYYASTLDGTTQDVGPTWSGPAATTGNAHALLVLRPGSFGGEPPLAYEAYQTSPLALSESGPSNVSFDMEVTNPPAVTLSGSVTGSTLGAVTHLMSVRFADGSVLPILNEDADQEAFSYLLPTLPNSSLVVAASDGVIAPYAVVHVDGVPASQGQNVALALPRPVSLSTPGSSAEIGPGTTFSWSSLGLTAKTFVWHLESQDFREGIYVITNRTQIEYPVVPGASIRSGPAVWSVETHGDVASVDAATGPTGFFDSFSFDRDVGVGPARGSGYYTESEWRPADLQVQ